MWWPKDWEHISGTIPETEVSTVKRDTDVAPDIGRTHDDYSCWSNADSSWGATSSNPENWTGTGWQRLIGRYRQSIVCVKGENLSKKKNLATLRGVNTIYIHTTPYSSIDGRCSPQHATNDFGQRGATNEGLSAHTKVVSEKWPPTHWSLQVNVD